MKETGRHGEACLKTRFASSPREERVGRGLRRGEFPAETRLLSDVSPPLHGGEGEEWIARQVLRACFEIVAADVRRL
jgi:hypothetical protein